MKENLSHDAENIVRIFALLWTYDTAHSAFALLERLQIRRQDGRPFTQTQVNHTVVELTWSRWNWWRGNRSWRWSRKAVVF